ncbi:hypothetical protein X975_06711, partial [Stegodyphus mimosarum]
MKSPPQKSTLFLMNKQKFTWRYSRRNFFKLCYIQKCSFTYIKKLIQQFRSNEDIYIFKHLSQANMKTVTPKKVNCIYCHTTICKILFNSSSFKLFQIQMP